MKTCIPKTQRQKVSPTRNSLNGCCSGKSRKGGRQWGCDHDLQEGGKNGAPALKKLTGQGEEGGCLCPVCPNGSLSVWFLGLTSSKLGQEERLYQPRKVG